MQAQTGLNERSLIESARAGDEVALTRLFELHQRRLLLMIRARMNPRLQRRLDDCDVLQDALVEVVRRLPEYLAEPRAPFFLWLRQIVRLKILEVHRQHLGVHVRDARREVELRGNRPLAASSVNLAEQIVGTLTSPSGAAVRIETRSRLQEALNSMDEMDREILSLRHFEELGNQEAAAELGIETSAASKRYVRALLRLETILKYLGLSPDSGISSCQGVTGDERE